MKIRKGFVSNSSSSSFVCDVCGKNASGYDLSLSESAMSWCQASHIFCDKHADEDYNIQDLPLQQKREFIVKNAWDEKEKKKWANATEEENNRTI